MTTEEFKRKLLGLGIEWVIAGNKICVKCPFSKHENMKEGRVANILLGMTTDFGECGFCGAKTNSESLIDEYEKDFEKQKSDAKPRDYRGTLIKISAMQGNSKPSINAAGTKTGSENSKDTSYVEFALASGIKLFHDQYQVPYAMLPDKKKRCVKISSKDFSRWLVGQIYTATKKALKKNQLDGIIATLEAQALYSESQYDLDVRIVSRDDSIWYDLSDGSAVKINRSGWSIEHNIPILFRSYAHQREQIIPLKTGGDIKKLLEFINIPKGELDILQNQLLLLVWLVFSFIPDYPHPILTLHGPQGSAKTTAFKIFKSLIDPSRLETHSLSSSLPEFIQMASHHYFIPLDNLTSISPDYSDLLCRICTGEGFSKRVLFSDDDDTIYSYRRVLGLNGININASKADLLDRSLLIGLERVKVFEGEQSFKSKFEAAKPEILGGIFDVLAKAFAMVGSVPEPGDRRMADFAKYGCAIAQAMGFASGEFIKAYKRQIMRQNDEALAARPISSAIAGLMERINPWVGTTAELLSELNREAGNLGIDIKSRTWPKEPNWVLRRMREIKPNLESEGIYFKENEPTAKKVTIWKDVENVEGGGNDDIPTFPTEPTLPAL